MIRYLIFIAGILAHSFTYGQHSCDSSILQDEKQLLQNFWTTFKDAVNNKDKAKLASLCRFPFNCAYCITDSSRPATKSYIKVNKQSFDTSQYKIFFVDRLVKEINKYNLPQDLFIFQPYYNSVDKVCCYSFGYIASEENTRQAGRQNLFDIQKINGQFKIISAWSIP